MRRLKSPPSKQSALLSEIGRGERIVDAKLCPEAILPIERSAIDIEAASLHGLVMLRPSPELLERIRHHRHIVVHKPKPCGAKLVSAFDACGKTSCAARVLLLRNVIELARFPWAALLLPRLRRVIADPVRFIGILVINHHDSPRHNAQLADGA